MYWVDSNCCLSLSAGLLRKNRFPWYSTTSTALLFPPLGPESDHLRGNSPTSVSLKSSKKIILSPGMKSYFEKTASACSMETPPASPSDLATLPVDDFVPVTSPVPWEAPDAGWFSPGLLPLTASFAVPFAPSYALFPASPTARRPMLSPVLLMASSSQPALQTPTRNRTITAAS